jgi:hypothetical protein
MHRSGTSAVAEALIAAGLNGGSSRGLMTANPQNPEGFGERNDVQQFNDRLLASLDWIWDAPGAMPLAEPPARAEFVAEGQRIVQEQLAGERPFMIKDPRISLLLPWWRQILLDRFVPVVVFRDAAEVGWSLAVRDGFSPQLALSLYAAYYRHVVAGLSGMSSITVDFGALCERPDRVVGELLDRLTSAGIEMSFDSQAAADRVQPLLRRATQPPELDDALRDIPALADIAEQRPEDDVAVRDRFAPIAPPTAWERAVLDVQRSARTAQLQANDEQANVAQLKRDLEHTAKAHEARVSSLMAQRDAARQSASEQRGRYETAYRQLTVTIARLETITAEGAATESDLRRQVALAARERDVLVRRIADFQNPPVSQGNANVQLAAAGSGLQAATGRGLSPRSLAFAARDRYRRLIVRMPRSLIASAWHNPLFDHDWYAEQNKDLGVTSRRRLETHFRVHGLAEGRLPNRLFHPAWYLAANPDVAASGTNPLDHYLMRGAQELRNPGPAFDTVFYLASNPDVVASGMNPLEHYLRFGRLEGRPTQAAEGPRGVPRDALAPTGSGIRVDPRLRRRVARRQLTRLGGPELFPVIGQQPSGNGSAARNAGDDAKGTSPASALPLVDDVRLIALYRSDTDWPRVARAIQIADSQRQPHVPSDLGFYDLRLPETRSAQARMAADHGIYGFCYDASWGHMRAGTGPLLELASTNRPDFRFTLRMTVRQPGDEPALTSLSRAWLDANLEEVDAVFGILRDRRAIRVAGSPMLIVDGLSPSEGDRASSLLRDRARSAGLNRIFLVACASTGTSDDAASLGVDAILGTQPDTAMIDTAGAPSQVADVDLRVAAYDDYARAVRASVAGSHFYEMVVVGWDDAPAGAGLILTEPTPQAYGEWLRSAISSARDRLPTDQRFVFVASWNDWPHGAHLEPDVHNGHAYLDATRATLVTPAVPGAAR